MAKAEPTRDTDDAQSSRQHRRSGVHLSALIVSSFALLIAIAALVPSPPPNLEHLER